MVGIKTVFSMQEFYQINHDILLYNIFGLISMENH